MTLTFESEADERWIVALAEGFKAAGANRSPIVPRAETIKQCIADAIRAAVEEEREACLQIMTEFDDSFHSSASAIREIVKLIRARSPQPDHVVEAP